ncbi:hypothetical protein VTN77DRAFT_571 [Rasamsonia byssochlamydoides]|uniref:uncharacterized protein n=1 Tax=Rasamsonia byssochlamydoides TaxID=89139 RepID=UPI003742CC72
MSDDNKANLVSQEIENTPDLDTPRNDNAAALVPPPALAALSEAGYARLGRRATLKLDLIIMPCVVVMYILNYLDRQNIASAKLATIMQDLRLTDVQYQTCISLLFVGYILMQVPSNMIAGKTRFPGVYICAAMCLWGLISACTAAVHSFTGLVLSRFFLGFVEAAFFPGALFYLSLFYTRKQFALRTAILYSGSQLGNAFGGLFAIAILKLDGTHGLAGWRWLFLVEGVATIGIAAIFAVILPNGLHSIRGFSELEREWLRWNFAKDLGQQDNTDEISAWKGLVMATQDPKAWLLMAVLWSTYVAAAVTNWFPSVVATLGYSRNTTYALTAPPYLLCVVAMMVNGFHSDRKQERFLHIVCPLIITLVANIIAVSSLNTAARYFAMMLMPGSFYASSIVILSWITGSLAQPTAKRASAIALINAVCNTPNIWTSYLYYAPPRYLAAFLVNLAAASLAISFTVATWLYLRRQNAKLDRGLDPGKNGPTAAQLAAGFRYIL